MFKSIQALAAAAALVGALSHAPASAADRYVTIGGGGTGGTYFVVAAGMAKLLTDNMTDVSATSRISTGTLENVRLVGRKSVEFGIAGSSGAWATMQGEDPFQNEKYENLRYAMSGYSSVFQFLVPADSDIKSIADLKGKTLGIISGTTVTTWFPGVAQVYGIGDDYKASALNVTDLVDSMRDGDIDALIYAGAAPNPAISDLMNSRPMRLLAIDADKAEEVRKLMPYWTPVTFPKSTYPTMEEDILILSQPNLLITHADVPEDIVYNMVKVIAENGDYLKNIHPDAAKFNLENAGLAMVIPPHPGAAKYYQEKGVQLPASN